MKNADLPAKKSEPAPSWLTQLVRVGLLIVIVGCGARVAVRAGDDALGVAADFRSIFLASTAWRHGQNPYEIENLRAAWADARGEKDDTVANLFDETIDGVPHFWHDTPPLYPPPTLAAVAPITLIPWPAARILWLGLNLVLTALAWGAAVRLGGMKLLDCRALLLGAIWLFLGPYTTCVRLGNPAAHAVALTVLSLWCAASGREALAALLIAIATALKPQIGGAFIIYFLLTRRWSAGAGAIGLLAIVTIVGVARLAIGHVPWMASLQTNLHAVATGGAFNDPTAANPSRWQLINLQVLLHVFLQSRPVVNAVAWLVTIVLGLAYLRYLWTAAGRIELLAASVPALLCLMPVYHRYYDSLTIVLPAAWAVTTLCRRGAGRLFGIIVLIGTLPFYINLSWLFGHLAEKGHVPVRIVNSLAWNAIAMPCLIWTLLGMLVCLVCAMAWHARHPEAGSARGC